MEQQKNICIIGDVGGTNVRLQLISLSGKTYETKEILKNIIKYDSQKHESLQACINHFLSDVSDENYPSVGVIGMAGLVENNSIFSVNLSHWGVTNGNQLAENLGVKSFTFINDFTAAGYGISRVTDKDCVALGDSGKVPLQEGEGSVKVVMGPGTGLGQGILFKKDADGHYEPSSSEGGHVDFTVKTQEDWDLVIFAREYIENSNNIENLRGKGKVGRLSIERLCAGPAVPLIYSFMKNKYSFLDTILEKGPNAKKFDDLESKDIIQAAINLKDPLCMKVVEKFSEIFGTQCGNFALKLLPYGGIYLIGGVTNGIKENLQNSTTFMDHFCDKGRLDDFMESKFRVMVVNPELEIGMLGAEEKARREFL